MVKQVLFIITGLPYSGKTTLTNELVKRFKFSVASVDEVLDEQKYNIEKMTQDGWDFAYSEAFRRLEKKLSLGESVIFDGGSLKRSERDSLKRRAEKMHIPWKLIYVRASKKMIEDRWLENQKTKQRGHLEKESLGFAFNIFEEPAPEEGTIIYESGTDKDEWINQNLNFLQVSC